MSMFDVDTMKKRMVAVEAIRAVKSMVENMKKMRTNTSKESFDSEDFKMLQLYHEFQKQWRGFPEVTRNYIADNILVALTEAEELMDHRLSRFKDGMNETQETNK